LALNTTEVQQSESQEPSQNISDVHGSPKETKAQRKFMVFVEIRKVKDDLYVALAVILVTQRMTYIGDKSTLYDTE
jgi:hypothetical protein